MFNWDNQLPGVYVLLSNLTGYQNSTFTGPVRATFSHCRPWDCRQCGESMLQLFFMHAPPQVRSSFDLFHGCLAAALLGEKLLGNPACCDSSPRLQAETFLGSWLDAGNGVARSPAFASWLGPTGALRNQANAALLAWVYGRGSGGGPGKLICWAEFQVRPTVHAVQ